MAGLAFAVAASANFPALLLAIVWRPLSTWGAVASILVGALSALLLIVLSPTIQVDVLGHSLAEVQGQWWFVPLRNPAIISMPLSLVTAVLVSLLTPEHGAAARFLSLHRRVLLGPPPTEAAVAGIAEQIGG